MTLLKRVPEAAMVAAFLRAEIDSPRFGGDVRRAMRQLNVETAVILRPDITNDRHNEARAQVLGECRGYRRNEEIFEGVPTDLTWYEAELSRTELDQLHYIDYSYWNELTDDSHLVRDAVMNIQRGKTVFDVPNEGFLRLAAQIRGGRHDFEPIIVWGSDADSTLVILEGHVRATAFGLAGDAAPAIVRALVGLVNDAAALPRSGSRELT